MERFRNIIGRLTRKVANKWHRYCSRENAELRERLQQQQCEAFVAAAAPIYIWFADYILMAIWNCAEAVHFHTVSEAAQICYRFWLQQSKEERWILVYRCRYHGGYGLSQEDFKTAMKTELAEVCYLCGIPDVPVAVRLRPDNIAYIVVPLDWTNFAYQNALEVMMWQTNLS